MSKMNRILNIGADTVTVEAGAIYIDIAKAIEEKQLQFYMNTEIGNLSAGSAACAARSRVTATTPAASAARMTGRCRWLGVVL